MPTQLLPCGPTFALTANVVYALPAVKTTIYCADTTPGLEVSNVFDFATKNTVTLTAGVATVAGKFVRSTAGALAVALMRD